MITTRHSAQYTPYALQSFFQNTPTQPTDKIFLIDNDSTWNSEDSKSYSPLTVIKNSKPKGFSENVNTIMARAVEERADLYFLNNDLIFTPGWIDPLLTSEPSILSPLSNREVQYTQNGFTWQNFCSLEDYLPRMSDLQEIVQRHKDSNKGYRSVISLPFFCVKIPFIVASEVGYLDESFGRGGAEDDDYCLRTYLKGFEVKYALGSYLLHFSGRSTWAGAESKSETEARCMKFRETFREKWGEPLFDLLLNQNNAVIESSPDLRTAATSGNIKKIVQILSARGQKR